MTPDARTDAAFELLRLSAARVSADAAIVEVEGRFPRGGRFARPPRLVAEAGDRRVEHAPVHAETSAGRWRGTFALDAGLLDEARLALGIRGALLELPPPDMDEGDRFAALARETNALRRALEAAELDAATVERELRDRVDAAEHAAITAREEAAAELERARAEGAEEVARVREEAAAELELARAEEVARVREEAAAELERARAEAAAELERARADAAAEIERARADAAAEIERAGDESGARVAAAQERAAAAEQRAAALEIDASAARDAEADERRRAQAAVAELQAALGRARAEAREGATGERPGAAGAPDTEPLAAAPGDTEPRAAPRQDAEPLAAAPDDTEPLAAAPETQRLEAVPAPSSAGYEEDDDQATRGIPVVGRPRPGASSPAAPERHVTVHREPSPARWVAVGALLVFFVVLLLLLGFL